VTAPHWNALVLAAGRGPDDPMAKAYRVTHKCLVEIGGEPMLKKVIRTLLASSEIASVTVSIENKELLADALGPLAAKVAFLASSASAARSALAALPDRAEYPCLITTGDHPLLSVEMLQYFLAAAAGSGADLCAGVARAETILARFPDVRRTYLKFGPDRVSGCNLFALTSPAARQALAFWHDLENVRKQPWRLVGAFGAVALLRFFTGALTLDSAFALASRRLALTARPVLMPFAEAAVDIDKPADKELAEKILRERETLPA
jgi:CTP:molybdopterin cytidylyltransferase MocA